MFAVGNLALFQTKILKNYDCLLQILYMEDDIFTVNGAVSILDMKGTTMSHFTQITPLMMKKMVVAGQVSELTIGLSKVLVYQHMGTYDKSNYVILV